jgi:hypothetical protein
MNSNERMRFWQGVSLVLSVGLVAAAASSGFVIRAQTPARQRFGEIDVERINVIERDGTVKLVIANRAGAPDQVSDGQSRPRAENNKSPGITCFDDAGDEAGGLKIRGDRRAGPSARRHLLFDQHRGDQVVRRQRTRASAAGGDGAGRRAHRIPRRTGTDDRHVPATPVNVHRQADR